MAKHMLAGPAMASEGFLGACCKNFKILPLTYSPMIEHGAAISAVPIPISSKCLLTVLTYDLNGGAVVKVKITT
jgi:hypothetical protein